MPLLNGRNYLHSTSIFTYLEKAIESAFGKSDLFELNIKFKRKCQLLPTFVFCNKQTEYKPKSDDLITATFRLQNGEQYNVFFEETQLNPTPSYNEVETFIRNNTRIDGNKCQIKNFSYISLADHFVFASKTLHQSYFGTTTGQWLVVGINIKFSGFDKKWNTMQLEVISQREANSTLSQIKVDDNKIGTIRYLRV